MKAFASRLAHPSSPTRSCTDLRSQASSRTLSEPHNALQHTISNVESTTRERYIALASPCYFHSRFDDAVNINKVLEEIAADESMSHSRLVQTATGVREVSKQLQRRPIKRAVRTVMIVTKARDNQLVTYTRELTEWLIQTPRYGGQNGVNVYVDEKLRDSKRFDAAGLVSKNSHYERMLHYWTPDICWSNPDRFDLVLTLGGDGTVLYTSWLFQKIVPPILSFSLGSLGFLTPFNFQEYRDWLNSVMGGLGPGSTSSSSSSTGAGNTPKSLSTISTIDDIVPDAGMRVNLRMRFTCTVHRAARNSRSSLSLPTNVDQVVSQYEVLNELVIDRGPSPYVSNLELFGNDSLLTVIQADGVIFSTPTGSTAYSLSAGGSLVHPDIPAILLTPICPHTLSFRPMLLTDTMALRVAVPRSSRATAYCSFDGKGRIELRQGDSVTIAASRYPFPIVSREGPGLEWIDSVSRTLRWNTREAQQKGWGTRSGGTEGRPESISGRMGSISLGQGLRKAFSSPDADDDEEDAIEAEEDFDIDIDDDDPVDSRDSGYEGDNGSNASDRNGGVSHTAPKGSSY
ncbi:MAG: NAD(+) kinase [Chrysothrix sp. TS-e1954]|nr:MAG: NAD(+) kinase [Chrysothrix sp. TS-e1954]